MSDFKPGDLVRVNFIGNHVEDGVVVGIREQDGAPWITVLGMGTYAFGNRGKRDERITLVSRPVYPEPGQVAIVLDEATHLVLVDAAASIQGATDSVSVADRIFDALLDRARDAKSR